MASGQLEVNVRGGVAWVTLRRPDKLNSLSTGLLDSLRSTLLTLCQSPEPRLVAITGEGRFFSAGVDLEEVAAAGSPEEAARPFRALRLAIEAILNCSRPVVALLNGPAVAGGAELALAADAAYAVEGAWLQWPELAWGLIPPVLSSIAGSLGPGLASRLIVAMERLPAGEAASAGLLAGVYPTLEEARGAVEGLAAGLGQASPEAVEAALEAVRAAKRGALPLAERLEALAASPELVERARRFLESRGRGRR